MAARLMFVHALSSLHAGTGQGVGTIDLPIARERATDLPVIPGSSIKGCLREAC
jgi:CRISPR-associated protein Cmr4